jgi:cyanophycin synthetase
MDLKKLHTNQRLLIEALYSHGASVRILDPFEELIEVSYNGKIDFLLDRFSSKVPYHVVKMSADKHFTKNLLRNNHISTPIGHVFTSHTFFEAIEYAKTIYPVVLKPNWGSHGDDVQVNLKNEEELKKAIFVFIENNNNDSAFIIEQFYPWQEYRLFITSAGGFAVIHRQSASIIGNGIDNIEQLVEQENKYRIELKKSVNTALCPIVLDYEVNRYLCEQNLTTLFIPPLGQQIFLRAESNLAKGGKAIDMTDIVHPSIKQLAINTLSCFPGLPVAGLDLLCKDITTSINEDNYTIIEVNSNPGLTMHTYPTEGKSRNVAKLLVEVMFTDLIENI